jgi:preprotein translocase subunit SecF
LFVGAGLLGAGTLKDLSLALFIGLITGTYSSICIATPILAGLREREPAMKALAKRVGTRGEKVPVASPTIDLGSRSDRGPRNQPKRDRRR